MKATLAPTSVRSLGAMCRAISNPDYWSAWAGGDADQPFGAIGARRDGLDAVWTYSAVTAIAEAVARLPRQVMDAENNAVDRGPLNDLLCRPNDLQDPREFFEELVIELLGADGAVAIIKDRPSSLAIQESPSSGAALPTSLFVGQAHRFRPVWSPGKPHQTLSGWIYTAPVTGEQIPFEVGEIIPMRLPGSGDRSPLKGLSPQVAARRAIQLDREMGRYAGSYFEHDATPSMILATERPLTPMQIQQMTRKWEHRHRGASRAHRVAVLHKGLKPVAAPALKDLAFVELAKQTREQQSAVYNVPPIVLGIVDDANRSNSDAQMAMFILGPVLGTADRIAWALNVGLISAHPWPDTPNNDASRASMSRSRCAQLREMRQASRSIQRERRLLRGALERVDTRAARAVGAPAADGLQLVFDVDSHPTVVAQKLERGAEPAKSLFDMGVPVNHIMDMLDLQLPREATGDIPFLSFNLAPAETIANPQPLGEPEFDDDANPRGEGFEVDGVRRMALRGIRERHVRTFEPLARLMERTIRLHQREQRDGVLDRLASFEDDFNRAVRAPLTDDQLDRIVFDLTESRGRIVARTRATRDRTARLGAAQGAHEAGLPVKEAAQQARILVRDPAIRRVIRQSEAVFTLIEEDRWRAVRATIRDAFQEGVQGKTFNELLQELKSFYDGSFTSARRTALTETVKVLNSARHESGKAIGANGKLWLTTSGNVRATHRAAERQYGSTPIPIDQDFIVGGAALRFPADPNGPLKEIIQCQCLQLFAFRDDAEDRNSRDPRAALDRIIERYGARGFVTLDNLEVADADDKD